MPVDIYDLLATQEVNVTTLSQLDGAVKNTIIDRTNTKFWNGPITVYRTIEASRTYPHGHPIPERSSIDVMAIDPVSMDSLKPTSPGLFQILSVSSSVDVTLTLTDGATGSTLALISANVPFVPSYPLIITPTLYLMIQNTGGESATVTIPYHTVGL